MGSADFVNPKTENTCAVVVTYYPDRSFSDRLKLIAQQVDKVVIVDNTPEFIDLPKGGNVYVIRRGKNVGVATALNDGIRNVISRGYDYALLFDQDTEIHESLFGTYVQILNAYPNPERVAVLGANYSTSRLIEEAENDGLVWQSAKTVITSGSLIPLDKYRSIGPFRDEFFIDAVDHEYCLRARSLGYDVIQSKKVLMRHDLGNTTRHKLPWKMSGTSNHAPKRRYYMARNNTALVKEYFFKEPGWCAKSVINTVKSTGLMMLFERERLSKLKNTMAGLWDGMRL